MPSSTINLATNQGYFLNIFINETDFINKMGGLVYIFFLLDIFALLIKVTPLKLTHYGI
jgi:hypothetical protein|tara:strand:+ start:433 stop:609 length:177 start_codon:yes stop_codon:yes gene_type:complete